MKAIYKHVLNENTTQLISTHENSEILAIKEQNGFICMWILTDLSAPKCEVMIKSYGTGWSIDPDANEVYIDTVIDADGYVWHYFTEA